MHQKLKFSILLLIVPFLFSCSTFGLKPMSEWTPKQKADYFMRTYNSSAKQVDAVLKDPVSSTAAKDVAKKDKAILTQVYPLIQAFDEYYVQGKPITSIPSEKQIMDLFDRVVNKL